MSKRRKFKERFISLFGSSAPRPAPGPARPDTEPERTPDTEPERTPERKPDPDRKPGRPSPRPDRKPGPVTDPKNYLDRLQTQYFHTLAPDIRQALSPANPMLLIDDSAPLAGTIIEDRDNTYNRWYSTGHRLDPEEVPDQVRQAQTGYEKEIQQIIQSYLEEILGPLYHRNRENIDIVWQKPYEATANAQSSEPSNRPSNGPSANSSETHGNQQSPPENNIARELSRYERFQSMPAMSEENRTFLISSIFRSEIYYQFVQGFGILYMDGMFRMMRKELEQLAGPRLPDLYEQYHLNGHNTHHRVFFDVLMGRDLPEGIDEKMETGESEGRVWASTSPNVDDQTGNVTGMQSVAYAASDVGVVLAHEALKGFFQMLTPWARLNENYMNNTELSITRMALNSYWAEIRQFAMGPSSFTMFQHFLDSLEIESHPGSESLYLAIENLLLLPDAHLKRCLHWILEPNTQDEIPLTAVRNTLLCPLDDPRELDW